MSFYVHTIGQKNLLREMRLREIFGKYGRAPTSDEPARIWQPQIDRSRPVKPVTLPATLADKKTLMHFARCPTDSSLIGNQKLNHKSKRVHLSLLAVYSSLFISSLGSMLRNSNNFHFTLVLANLLISITTGRTLVKKVRITRFMRISHFVV